ncbi:TIGR01777 family protein [Pseudomonas sp. J237]|nr:MULTISPECIES: TIGR01777 family oxidoreductase [Pseudomonas]OEO27642.1 TIGR01777 family protein [Pseudomonas sp. J237]
MHILLTGGTGLIGRGLCHLWAGQGHQLTVLSRTPERVAELCGAKVRGIATLAEVTDEPLDAVINLAGEPIADKPWSSERKTLLWSSRIGLTEELVAWLGQRAQKPAVLVSGSAVGWYGDGGERELAEDVPQVTNDFAAQLCNAWEEAAMRAEAQGIRVVLVRTGLVLANKQGFLKRLIPLYKMCMGGNVGSGRQWMPWVHLADEIGAIDFLMHHQSGSGPYNVCSPHPVRNREFTYELAHALSRFAVLPVPSIVLRMALGEMSGLLLAGQRCVPQRLLDAGYKFRFTRLDVALADLLSSH